MIYGTGKCTGTYGDMDTLLAVDTGTTDMDTTERNMVTHSLELP